MSLEHFVRFQPLVTALPGSPLNFQDSLVPLALPPVYTTQGGLLFASGSSSNVPASTPMDVQRFQNDLAALTPGNQVQLFTPSASIRISATATSPRHIGHRSGNWICEVQRLLRRHVESLASILSPNSYGGADPAFAPYTQFNPAGHASAIRPGNCDELRLHFQLSRTADDVTQNSARWD